MSEEKGVWRTIRGRKVFIKEGQSLTDAMRESGKFNGENIGGTSDSNHKKESAESVSSSSEVDSILGKEFKGVKGQDAIHKLLQEKQGHVKGAFHREDIGDIDLVWGNDELGLQHIVKHREKQGIDVSDFTKDLTSVIESGEFRKKNDRGNFEFMREGKIAVISPELRGTKLTFLLTAFKTHSKK